MRDRISTLHGIKLEEESFRSMLLAQAVFLGIFVGAYDITAHSLFLSVFDEKMLARGYMLSGLTGIILAYLFSRLQKTIQFKTFELISLGAVAFLTIILWLATVVSISQWVSFFILVMFGPLNLIALLGLRYRAALAESRSREKELTTAIDAGFLSGIVAISFLIPVLLAIGFRLNNILLLGACFILIALVTARLIEGRDNLHNSAKQAEAGAGTSLNNKPGQKQYTTAIILFTGLSVLSAFFIQYLFMAETRIHFPSANGMAEFLGIYSGCLFLVIIFLKHFAFNFLLRNYGLRACLLVTPVFLALIVSLVLIVGLAIGYTPDSATGFVLFFILLALARFISRALKDSIESSTFKIIIQSFISEHNAGSDPGEQGVRNETMVFTSGLFLTLLGLAGFMHTIHFAIVLLIILSAWIIIGLRLFRIYKLAVIKTAGQDLPLTRPEYDPFAAADFKNRFTAGMAFRKNYFSLLKGDFVSLSKENPYYFDRIISHAVASKDYSMMPVLKNLTLNLKNKESLRDKSAEAFRMLNDYLVSPVFVESKSSEAIRVLSGTRKPQTTEILRLLRDSSLESRRMAIYMIGKFHLTDLVSDVCSCLNIPGLTLDAAEVLKSFGSEVEKDLVRFYLQKSGNVKLSRSILQILGHSCTKETRDFLFARLWANSRQLKELSAKNLLKCNFTPADEEKIKLDQLISDVIGIVNWYLFAKICLERDKMTFLLDKIKLELKRWNAFLYDLLCLNYNPASIARIYENIETGTIESVIYALEMANVIISASVKPRLFYLLDVVPDEVRVKNLAQYYAGEVPNYKRLEEDILNRDYNLISLWTKACTLRTISKIDSDDIAESVTALLFSPEDLIQEEAACLISRSNSGLFDSAAERLPEPVKKRLENIMHNRLAAGEFLLNKVQFLSAEVGLTDDDELISLASDLKYRDKFEPGTMDVNGGYVLWLFQENDKHEVHIIYNGEAGLTTLLNRTEKIKFFYFLPFTAIEQFHFQFPEKSSVLLKYVDREE